MHHKKHRVGTQKEYRRIDKKRHRQAERTVLEGGKPRQVKDYSWSHRPEPSVILDRANPVKGGRPKSSPKKGRCPRNPNKRAHEFVQDSWPDRIPRRWYYGTNKMEDVTRYHRLCLHCGLEQWKTHRPGKYKYGGGKWQDHP
jgi:hypothetical protein